MSAKTDALHDIQDGNAVLTSEQCWEKVKEQCAAFYARYKDSNPAVMSITEAAQEIGCSRYIISAMAQNGHVWSVFARFKTGGRTYKARIVNVDKCREVLKRRACQAARLPKKIAEQPPENMIRISVLAREMAMNLNTLRTWAKRHELTAKKYIAARPGAQPGLQWHADRDEAHALLVAKLAGPYSRAMRRILSIPITPQIAKLWGLSIDEPVCPEGERG